MGLLAGILRKEDLTPVNDVPVRELAEAVNALNARYVAERNAWRTFLVQGQTTEHMVRHLLGGVDEGQKVGPDGRVLETRPAGKIEVAFPWERIGWAMGWNYETQARMTLADLERNVASKQAGNAKRHLREMFRAIFPSANYTYKDEDKGDLTVRRLANGDGTTYPPTTASDAEADDNHYLVSGYAPNAMSATNNPFVTLRDELVEHYGAVSAVVAIINNAQRAEVMTDLPNFVDGPTAGITPGATAATADPLDGANVPGRFLGIEGDSGVYVYVNEEGRVPANYVFGGLVGAPAPLMERIPREAALQGFKLEAEEEHYPMFKREYRDRFGYAVAERLSAAVMFLDAGGSYVVPAAYA